MNGKTVKQLRKWWRVYNITHKNYTFNEAKRTWRKIPHNQKHKYRVAFKDFIKMEMDRLRKNIMIKARQQGISV